MQAVTTYVFVLCDFGRQYGNTAGRIDVHFKGEKLSQDRCDRGMAEDQQVPYMHLVFGHFGSGSRYVEILFFTSIVYL